MSRLTEFDLTRLNAKAYRKRVREVAEHAIDRAYSDIDEKVAQALDNTIKQVVPALLGLRRGFGDRWELNRTNGIDREHPLGTRLRQAAQSAAERFVTEALEGFTPGEQMKASVRAAYKHALTRAGEEMAAKFAYDAAAEWAEDVVAEMMAGKDVEAGPTRQELLAMLADWREAHEQGEIDGSAVVARTDEILSAGQ